MQVVRVDQERRQIDLGLEEVLEAVRDDERRRGPQRSQARPKKEQRKGTPEQRRKIKAKRAGENSGPGRRERAVEKAMTITSSSAPPGTSITARARWCRR